MSQRLRAFLFVIGAGLITVLLVGAWSTSWLAAFGGSASGERLARMQASPQYGEDAFTNRPPVVMQMESDSGVAWSVLSEWFSGEELRVPDREIPLFDGRDTLASPPSSGLRVTWLGHSTVLIEIDGLRILTDPVWGERVSPSSIAGPKRFHRPPYEMDELGDIDAVIISHDHYDHLDHETILALKDRGVPFFVPLGVGAHFEAWGVPTPQIREFDWWEEANIDGVRLVSTPSRHFSGRTPFDRNATLWTSWSVIGPDHRVFFSGDTGPTPFLAEIAEKLGPFDVTMLEVGAWHPAWGEIHLGPEAAIDAFIAMGNHGVMLPIHWSTFELALHGWSQPAEHCVQLADEKNVRLTTPRVGRPFEPSLGAPRATWWR